MQGTGSLTLTGQLGDVMKESARAALSWFRAHAQHYGVDPDVLQGLGDSPARAIRRHPEGRSVGRRHDGDGARLGADRRPVRGDVAMTGEITLSGRVLPVGGIKEKVLAARRAGIREVILPKQNEKNVKEDLTEELRRELTMHYVTEIADAVAIALQPSSGQTTTPMPVEEHQTV